MTESRTQTQTRVVFFPRHCEIPRDSVQGIRLAARKELGFELDSPNLITYLPHPATCIAPYEPLTSPPPPAGFNVQGQELGADGMLDDEHYVSILSLDLHLRGISQGPGKYQMLRKANAEYNGMVMPDDCPMRVVRFGSVSTVSCLSVVGVSEEEEVAVLALDEEFPHPLDVEIAAGGVVRTFLSVLLSVASNVLETHYTQWLKHNLAAVNAHISAKLDALEHPDAGETTKLRAEFKAAFKLNLAKKSLAICEGVIDSLQQIEERAKAGPLVNLKSLVKRRECYGCGCNFDENEFHEQFFAAAPCRIYIPFTKKDVNAGKLEAAQTLQDQLRDHISKLEAGTSGV